MNKITVCWIYSNRYFVKKLKKPQISSKSHGMTFLRPKQSMNSLLGVKIAQNPYFWFGYNSSKWRKITHWTCFSTTPNKSVWEFLYPAKNWLIFEAKKLERKRWNQLLQSIFHWKSYLLDMFSQKVYQLVKVVFNALSSFFALKMSFWVIIFH